MGTFNKVFRHSKPKLVLRRKQTMRQAEKYHVICSSLSHGLFTTKYKFWFTMPKHRIGTPRYRETQPIGRLIVENSQCTCHPSTSRLHSPTLVQNCMPQAAACPTQHTERYSIQLQAYNIFRFCEGRVLIEMRCNYNIFSMVVEDRIELFFLM